MMAALWGVFLGIVGVLAVGFAGDWWIAIGVFWMIWGNNVGLRLGEKPGTIGHMVRRER